MVCFHNQDLFMVFDAILTCEGKLDLKYVTIHGKTYFNAYPLNGQKLTGS